MNKRLTLRLVLVAVALVVRVAFYSSACSSSHDYSSFQAPSFSGHDPSADPGASDLSDLSDLSDQPLPIRSPRRGKPIAAPAAHLPLSPAPLS